MEMLTEKFSIVFRDQKHREEFLNYLIESETHFLHLGKSNIGEEFTNKKTCKECGKEKFWAEFSKDKKMKGGYRNTCRVCTRLQRFNKMVESGKIKRKKKKT